MTRLLILLSSLLLSSLLSSSIHGQVTESIGSSGAYRAGTCVDDGDVDSLETFCTVQTRGFKTITFMGAVATSAFTAFKIDLSNDGTTFVMHYGGADGTTDDYTSLTGEGILRSASADPRSWSTTPIMLTLDKLDGLHSIRLQAAGTNSNPAITWRLQ